MPNGVIKTKTSVTGSISGNKQEQATISAGAGVSDHNRLTNRDAADQHPISSITNLEKVLKTKMDSETIKPVIQDIQNDLNDALKSRARGMYYGVVSGEKKAYWYLCSEVDPKTGWGTADSIISGPYDLGSGGGGGGGGGSGITDLVLLNTEAGVPLWPSTAVVGGSCKVTVSWSSVRNGASTGKGTLTVLVNDSIVETRTTSQGKVTFDISKKIIASENKVEVKVVDAYSNTTNIIGTIVGVSIGLRSTFDYTTPFNTNVNYTYIPTGSVGKVVHFILDGNEVGNQTVLTTDEQQTYQLTNLSHGHHEFDVYFECNIDGEWVESNVLHYDLIVYNPGNMTPIIASQFNSFEQEQYISFNIPYRVYTPGKDTSRVELIENGEVIKGGVLNAVPQTEQGWEYKNDVPGTYNLIIRTGSVERTFPIHIAESEVNVVPVEQNLELALTSYGRNNTNTETRSTWEDEEHHISCTLTKFNYISDGWQKDADGNTVLRVSGDARVEIPFKPFDLEPKQTGETIEIELATSTVRNYESIIISCLDKDESITTTILNAGDEERTDKIGATVDMETFIAAVGNWGTYDFIWNGTNWTLNNNDVFVEEYGITTFDLVHPSQDATPMLNDTISIEFGSVNRGFYITPQLAKIQSQQSSISTQYKEEDHVRLAFTIGKNNGANDGRLISMYVNGILSGVTQYPANDNFRQLQPQNIIIGSNDATVDIYSIRIYKNDLNRRQIVNNWIADTQDGALRVRRYLHNDNFNDAGEIVISKLPKDLPYLIIEAPELPAYKGDKKLVNAEYVDQQDPTRNFQSTDASANVQGTSSQFYYRKNFKIKFQNGFYNELWEDTPDGKIKDGKRKKYEIIPGAEDEKTFTFKADVASSESANNVVLVKYFEDTKNWKSPAEWDKGDQVRVGIDGYPIAMFHNDGSTVKFYGKMNFNNDKANDDTYGFKDGDESWEILSNTNNLVLFKTLDFNGWQDAFESRYPEEYGLDEHLYGTQGDELDRLKDLCEWIYSTRRDNATGNQLPRPYEGQKYETTIVKETITVTNEDGEVEEREVETVTSKWVNTTFEFDTPEYRLAKFKKEIESIGRINLTSSLFFYLYTELFLMVDNRAKNAFPTWYRIRHVDGTNGEIPVTDDKGNVVGDQWYWIPYDMDTAIGTNNEGLLVFSPFLEDTDKVHGAYIYNGQDSTFWQNLRDAFPDEMKKMYQDLRSNAWSFDTVEKMYNEHQSKWSENIFNEDAYTKYLMPLRLNKDASYLGMIQGSKAQQRRWWLDNRFKYLDSKYNTGTASENTIMIRSYARSEFNMIPYNDVYVCAKFDNAFVTQRAKAGTKYKIIPPSTWDPAGTDSVVAVFSANQLRDLGDLSGFKMGGFADFHSATKIQRLVIGSPDPNYSNEKLETITVGNNTMLTLLDIRNCKKLGGAVDLSNCINIEEVYTDNTQITGVTLPVGGNMKTMTLPNTVTDLTVRGHSLLQTLTIAPGAKIGTLWLENIPATAIDAYDIIVNNMKDGAAVRLIGIDNHIDSTEDVENFYNALDRMTGLDTFGQVMNNAQVTGKIRVDEMAYSDWVVLSARYPEVEIIVTRLICTVNFWNDGVLHNTQNIVKDGSAEEPGIPRRQSTQKNYWIFNHWDKNFTNVQTDLDIRAVYDTFIQQYTVAFETESDLISAVPSNEVVYYETPCHEPQLEGIPEGVEFLGWHKPDGTLYNFDDLVLDHLTLHAVWDDQTKPTLRVERVAYNRIKLIGHDNLGITRWGVSLTDDEPETWTNIKSTTELVLEYTVNAAGMHTFYISDAQGNLTDARMQVVSISSIIDAGFDEFNLREGDEIIDDFVVLGTIARVNAIINKHYKDPVVLINGDNYAHGDEYQFLSSDNSIYATATPRTYVVSFDIGDFGESVDTQRIVYNHHVVEPDPQADRGWIIEGWYTDIGYTHKWLFDEDRVEENMLLYARWVEYHSPSIITIETTEPMQRISVAYDQYMPNGAEVDWGDGTPVEMSEDVIQIELFHIYEQPGTYNINITRLDGTVFLGREYDKQVVNPISVVKAVEFAFDVAYTGQYAFRNAVNLTEIKLTRYMTAVAAGTFEGCSGATNLVIPKNLKEIGPTAFKGCTGIQNITDDTVDFGKTLKLPDKLTRIADGAFQDCTSIEEVIVSEDTTYIAMNAFNGCTSLVKFRIPETETLTELADWMLSGCTALEEVIIPKAIQYVGANCFNGCSSLHHVVLENENVLIGEYCFNNCTSLNSAGPIGGNYNIEFAWTKTIPDNAFYYGFNESSLRTCVLPEGLEKIGNNAFFCCMALTGITLPQSLLSIGDNAFFRCLGIADLVIPARVRHIGQNAFWYCVGLNSIEIYTTYIEPDCKVNSWETAWFRGCTANVLDGYVFLSHVIDSDEYASAIFGEYWNYTEDGIYFDYNRTL